MTMQEDPATTGYEILETARRQVLEEGRGLTQEQLVEVLRLPDVALPAALQLAHEVRLRHCGEDVEVEGIVSIKTGGCPEDCHFCSQSGQFTSPVRAVWLNIPQLVQAAKETACAVIASLHDLGQGAAFDRVVLVDGGHVTADGRPADVLSSHALVEAFGVEKDGERWRIRKPEDRRSSP